MTNPVKLEHQELGQLPSDPMVSMIERVALDPSASIEKLEQMLAMKERMEAVEAKRAFNEAFSRAAAEFPTIPLNGRGHNNKPHATLKDIIHLTRPALSGNGLALTFAINVAEQVEVTAKLMHRAGHSESATITLPRDASGSKNAVQAVGSTQTYGQRYAAQAILGLSLGDDTDDDGQSAFGGTISAEQFVQLRDKLEESGMDKTKFHAAFGHMNPTEADLHQFPAKKFDEAMKRLETYMKAKSNG